MQRRFRGLVLAAGRGKRFATESGEPMPKVLRPILGMPMISYVLQALADSGLVDVAIVVGYRAEDVKAALGDAYAYAYQPEQKGSGHAVACAKDLFAAYDGGLAVMCGDSPLFRANTVREMMKVHASTRAAITLVTAALNDPSGYGRILRGESGRIAGVVEEKCATQAQRAIAEVNGGAYAFDAGWLFGTIDGIALNDAGEYNLTDMVRIAVEQGRTVSAVECDPAELEGVNTPEQLAAVEEIIRHPELGSGSRGRQ